MNVTKIDSWDEPKLKGMISEALANSLKNLRLDLPDDHSL